MIETSEKASKTSARARQKGPPLSPLHGPLAGQRDGKSVMLFIPRVMV